MRLTDEDIVESQPKSVRLTDADLAPDKSDAPWYERVWNAAKGESEDYPELPYSAQRKLDSQNVNPERARTFEGKFNMLKQSFPNASIAGQDKFGNPLISLGEETDKTMLGVPTGKFESAQKYYLNKPGLSMMDVTAGGGAAVEKTAPAVTLSTVMGPVGWKLASPAVGATAAATDLAMQAAANRQGANEGIDLKQSGKVGAATMLGEGFGRALSSGIELFSSRMGSKFVEQVVDKAGNLTDDAVTALRQAGIDPQMFSRALTEVAEKSGMPANEALRQAAAQSVGIKLTTGQSTGDLPQLRAEEIARQSGSESVRKPLVDRAVEQNRALSSYAQDIVSGTGGTADDLATGIGVKAALRSKKKAMNDVASQYYDEFANAAGVNSPLPKEAQDEFFKKVVPVLDKFEGDVPQGVVNQLKAYGMLGEVKRDLTLGEAKQFRELLNSHLGTTDPVKATAVNQIKSALDDSIKILSESQATSADILKKGIQASAAKHAEFSQKDLVQAVVSKKAQFTDLVPDEQVVKKLVFSGSIDDLSKVKRSLTTGTPKQIDEGLKQWQNLRATTFKNLVDEAMPQNVKNEAGEVVFSGARFNTALQRIGNEKLKLLYTPEELQKIHSLKLTADAITNLPRGAVNTSYTAPFLQEMKRATGDIPFLRYLVDKIDFKNKAIAKRALSEGAMTEAQRAARMGSRMLPKVGTAFGIEEGQQEAR
jgi:hypothetical protein